MALHSGLGVWCYTAPTSSTPLVGPVEYAEALDSLRYTSVAPGGFGQLTATLKVRDARVPRPELAIFSRVVVTCGKDALWIGEISESKAALQNGQEAVRITALGLGSAIRDDPFMFSYSGKTVQQIAQDQLASRVATSPYTTAALKGVIDADATQLFPDNPAGTYAPVWDFRTMEEVLGDLCLLAAGNTGATGLYLWGTEAHPTNRDAAGFPTVRLFARLKDTATTHFQASVAAGEVSEYEIGQSSERCYNDVDIGYNNGSGGVGRAVAKDTRLNADLSQGTAPFRWRKFARDLSGTSTLGSTSASTLASTLLAQYQDPARTGKSTITLKACRDASGTPTELARLAAGRNILVPEMAVRTTGALPTGPTPGVNQFYIVSAEYMEDQTGATVHLQCDNFDDYEAVYVAKLTLAADTRARSDKTNATFQAPGAPETGYCGGTFTASAGAQTGSDGQNFKKIMASAPSQVTLSAVSSVNVAGSPAPSTTNIDVYGFNVTWQSAAAGVSTYLAHYTTVGNCLLDVRDDGTFDWHCDGCEARLAVAHGCGDRAGQGCADCREAATHRGLRLDTHPHVHRPSLPDGRGGTVAHERPGDTGLAIACPAPGCGHIECFNTNLSAADEAHHDQRRAEQARLIRAAMRHPHVGLPTREEWDARQAGQGRRRQKGRGR